MRGSSLSKVKTTAKEVYCIQSLDKTEDQAKVLAQQFAGLTETLEDYEERLSNTETRIEAV